jgi:hypothetical protein
MNEERKRTEILLKCFDHLRFASQENLTGYDSEMLELKLMHMAQVIALSMDKLEDQYAIAYEERKEVKKIEKEIIRSQEDKKKREREEAKKKTLETLTKPLSEEAKIKYIIGTHTKAGKAPTKKTTLWNRVYRNCKKPEKELNDEEKHEIVVYVQNLHKNRKMKVGDALRKIGLDSWKYYKWRKNEGLVLKCKQCKTSKTPQWRQYKDGIYCNACGIKKYRKSLKKKNRGKK